VGAAAIRLAPVGGAAEAYTVAQAKEAECVAEPMQRMEASWFACTADVEAAIAEYERRGQGRHGRKPQPWRYHALRYRLEVVTQQQKRTQRDRSPQDRTASRHRPLSPQDRGRSPRAVR